jgi:hypothetical protein
MRPPKSWQEMKDVWEIVSNDWLDRIFHPVVLALISVSAIIAILVSDPFRNKLSSYAAMMFAGCAGFLSLMLLQLSYHDYYFITMFPVLLFFLFIIADTIHQKFSDKGRKAFAIMMMMAIGFQFYFARAHLQTSHNRDNWKYGAVYNDVYFDAAPILKAGGINPEDQVIIIFDHSPNISLYLSGLRGVTIPYRRLSETLMGYLHTGRYRFVLFNPNSQITDMRFKPADFPLDAVGEANGIQIFKVSSSFHPDGRTVSLSPWN